MSATEAARQKEFARQMKEWNALKFRNPERDYDLEKTWVAHVWLDGEWKLAGFRRKRKRRKTQTMARFFAKVRRQLGLDKKAPVMLMDLSTAKKRFEQSDQSWRTRPPQFQKRKRRMEPRMPTFDDTKHKRRAKVKAFTLHKRDTKFIALGRMGWTKELPDGTKLVVWEKSPGHLYLGPLISETLSEAKREAYRMYGAVYREVLTIPTAKLSAPLRSAMARSRKVRAGVSRIQWPEVPPTFDEVWAKYGKRVLSVYPDLSTAVVEGLQRDRARMEQQWYADGCPWLTVGWLRKQLKLKTVPSKVVWLGAKYGFECKVCRLTGKTPASINHGSPRCVPIPEEESAACAVTAKAHAKKIADRRAKRNTRRAEQKRKEELAKARRRAAKKAARTRAKARQSPRGILKRIVAKLKTKRRS